MVDQWGADSVGALFNVVAHEEETLKNQLHGNEAFFLKLAVDDFSDVNQE